VRRAALAFLLAVSPIGALGQVAPSPGFDDPRLQTVFYDPARAVRLVAFPRANLTVMLLPGERIQRAVLSDPGAFEVTVTQSADSLNILPLRADATASLTVDTGLRRYAFELETGEGLAAAYVVRFVPPMVAPPPLPPGAPSVPSAQQALAGEYRLTGERTLLPSKIGDDGERTYIEWGKYQSLPAVFGITSAGHEEVVDGYMREGVFTIDRVYPELVFRIDAKRARARRRGGLSEG